MKVGVEDRANTLDLFLVSLDGAWNLFWVDEVESYTLAVVWSLAW